MLVFSHRNERFGLVFAKTGSINREFVPHEKWGVGREDGK